MDPSETPRSSSNFFQRDQYCETFHQAMKYPSSRRTPSLSTSSSLSSSSSSSSLLIYNPNDSPLSPATPLGFSGVPFSWEHFPGIPKKQFSKKKLIKESSLMKNLPLPPPTIPTTTNKKFSLEEFNGVWIKKSNPNKKPFERDPFIAALVECSKDDDDDNHDNNIDRDSNNANFWNIATSKVSRSLSDRFGFVNLNTSCKRTCAVAESIRYLPRSTKSNYDLINSRSR